MVTGLYCRHPAALTSNGAERSQYSRASKIIGVLGADARTDEKPKSRSSQRRRSLRHGLKPFRVQSEQHFSARQSWSTLLNCEKKKTLEINISKRNEGSDTFFAPPTPKKTQDRRLFVWRTSASLNPFNDFSVVQLKKLIQFMLSSD